MYQYLLSLFRKFIPSKTDLLGSSPGPFFQIMLKTSILDIIKNFVHGEIIFRAKTYRSSFWKLAVLARHPQRAGVPLWTESYRALTCLAPILPDAVPAHETLNTSGLQTNGVDTNGAAAKVMNFDRLGKKVRPGTRDPANLSQVKTCLRPISVLRFWNSEGLTQAEP